jgi:hypothetical protein
MELFALRDIKPGEELSYSCNVSSVIIIPTFADENFRWILRDDPGKKA